MGRTLVRALRFEYDQAVLRERGRVVVHHRIVIVHTNILGVAGDDVEVPGDQRLVNIGQGRRDIACLVVSLMLVKQPDAVAHFVDQNRNITRARPGDEVLAADHAHIRNACSGGIRGAQVERNLVRLGVTGHVLDKAVQRAVKGSDGRGSRGRLDGKRNGDDSAGSGPKLGCVADGPAIRMRPGLALHR